MTREGTAAILRFLPIFERPGYVFGEFVTSTGSTGSAVLAPEVTAFLQALHDHHWIGSSRWDELRDEAERYLDDESQLEMADPETIRRLFTFHVGKDRVCVGHLLEVHQRGHVTAILRRLARVTTQGPGAVGRGGL